MHLEHLGGRGLIIYDQHDMHHECRVDARIQLLAEILMNKHENANNLAQCMFYSMLFEILHPLGLLA